MTSAMGDAIGEEFPSLIDLNVGGVYYTTTLSTILKEPDTYLSQLFSDKSDQKIIQKDSKGRYFLDRDGVLFRYVLDYLRNQKLVLPENFHERERLKQEAEFFKLPNMVRAVNHHHARLGHLVQHPQQPVSNHTDEATSTTEVSISDSLSSPTREALPKIIESGTILVAYRGTFAFGRDGLADVKFRKLSRILVCGRVSLCREAFGDTLNESRDPDRGTTDRYTSRYFLKHTFLEQAFDMLQEAGFKFAAACGSGTNSAGELKPGMDSEESKWNHYNEFIFVRE